MTDPQHKGGWTPGPWERLEGVVEVGHPIYRPGTVVTRIVQKRAAGQTEFVKVALVDTGPANARLIAAAPELYEALEQIAPFLGATDANDWRGLKDDDALSMPVKVPVGYLRAVKDALARAKASPDKSGGA